MTVLTLFLEFLKIGMFSVGGGMATLPFIYALSEKTGWYSVQEIADILAVSESTPGPIGINTATYVGYKVAGIPGALAASVGIIIPGLLLVIIIMTVLNKFRDNKYVNGAFYGLRPASIGLIIAAGLLVAKITLLTLPQYQETHALLDLFNWKALLLAAVLLVFTRYIKQTKNLHPIFFIAASALIGIVFGFA
ncbi:MAG: chromate transporter [Clostridia bacterium]|nr:chromate transporter [Clostridia bacterium]